MILGFLEWIGKSNESFTTVVPGWSGFVDVDSDDTNRTGRTLRTNGSNLNAANNIIMALTNNNVNLTAAVAADRPAIIFKEQSSLIEDRYGWNGVRGEYTLRVTSVDNETLRLEDANATYPDNIYEQYDLVHSAYAIVPVGNNPNNFDLTLHYNYQPWENERYDQNATTSLLMENVSTFQFIQIGTTIRIKNMHI